MTYGEFGLHTHDWLRLAWSGAFYWLGRLQFNLQRDANGEWVLSTHIPQSGPLDPAAVDALVRRGPAPSSPALPGVPDHRTSTAAVGCSIPQLADGAARGCPTWRGSSGAGSLYGEPMAGDEDALFFTFHRRGEVDLERCPATRRLQRVIIDRLRAGRHWQLWHGRCPQPQPERLPS